MELSLEDFIKLSLDEKIEVLKKNDIIIHPFLWLLLKDSLINSINTIYWIVKEKDQSNPPEAVTAEDLKKIAERCEQFNTNLLKIQKGLLPPQKD